MASATKSNKEDQSKKARQDEADKAAAEARKKEAEEKKAEEKKAKEEEREAKRVAKEEEKVAQRKEAVDSGKLVEGPNDGEEFWESEKDDEKDYTLDERAEAVIAQLKESKHPVMGKDILETHGGGYPLYIPIFSTLKALGLIKEYRRRTGERGGGGKAYLWVGDK